MKEIPLTRGYVALVDDEDYERLAAYKWRVKIRAHTNYAFRSVHGSGKTASIYMHREVLMVPPYMETDHINWNGLDNRKANLRECTHQENRFNTPSRLGSTSQFKGVYWNKHRQKWQSHIITKGVTYDLGCFLVEADAAQSYKRAAAIVHGEFAAGERGDSIAVGSVG